ncbi:putative transcriptional regulatory protein C530,05 OS=Schizosaccharomyces pombe (strain 972 / ATCC 24843) GN=SPBC530.05 PE=4 SV=2 [Rhizoctonia solani AG-1 IB]|uniref:Putative transcriptional regulatory protein C530,05 n=1 Tax=Thanatephorus cucumeris (strain AG1-IB / isolate 7/3/14) TaxID=1108050 RepID=A0A0B7FMC5_THACB|nr:putative transcriptional regulatory protein C530,05 OS=Schizosaccharomyces pombe (strain 972 / ATCC 24843) GN=SPBC530.05 PE=4 SV=2 [Rhizoctonia solani AG-1 IB]
MSYNQPDSSRDEPAPDEDVPLKIRRVTKACDLCRKRKARCDGDPASDRGCTLCTNAGVPCVFTRFARKRGHESSQARELESRIIELEGLIRLIAPGIDIEQELEESANSGSPDSSSTLLRPSDSAFLQPNDAFLRPSADSTAAFFHPSGVMFDPYSHEEETKPDLTRLASSAPLSPARSSPGNTTMYSPPGTTLGRSTPSSDSANPMVS